MTRTPHRVNRARKQATAAISRQLCDAMTAPLGSLGSLDRSSAVCNCEVEEAASCRLLLHHPLTLVSDSGELITVGCDSHWCVGTG